MKINFTLIAICLLLLNCENESKPKLEYQYATDQSILDCGTTDTKLFEEALLSFENDMIVYFKPKNDDLGNAYSQMVRSSNANRLKYNDIISDHTKSVYEALKADKNLWKDGQQGVALNYKHPIFECISEHITDKNLGTTYKALLSTGSMSPRMLQSDIQRHAFNLKNDKYLATHVALDMFYGQLHNVDFSQPKADLSGEIIDTKNSSTSEPDPHEGHNH